jgi:hypothetical protein
MSHKGIRRFAAVLLLGVLGSGFALPGLDELLYHAVRASVRADLAHIDRPGGCESHAEHCIAAPMVYAPRLTAAASLGLPIHNAFGERACPSRTSDPRSSDRHTPQQPRAPPTA